MKKVFSVFFVLLLPFAVCNAQSSINADSLHKKYLALCKYDSALYFAEETAAWVRGTEGENTIRYANALNNLVVSHFYLGNYSKAKYYVLKEVGLLEALQANNNANYISSLENASIICRKYGNHEEALELIKKAEKNASKIFNSESTEYANVLADFAGVYNDMGASANDLVFLKQGESYFKKAESIYKKNSSTSRQIEIVNKSNQAAYYNNLGNSPLAESLFLESISLCETEYGKTNPFYASALNNLGVFYYNRGNYKKSEKYFTEAVDIYSKNIAASSVQASICINNLGALYHDIGNYELAIKQISSAKEIWENNNLKQHPFYAVILNNLASVYLVKEYYASSENKTKMQLLNSGRLFLKADSIFDVNCKMPNPDGYGIKMNTALWYKMSGDTAKSLKIMIDQVKQNNISPWIPISIINKMSLSSLLSKQENSDAHSILEPVLISIKIKLTDAMVNERGLEENTKNQTASTRLIIKLIIGKADKIKKALGPYHPGYADLIKSLIPLYWSIGDYDMEQQLKIDYINIISYNTLQDFSFLSESEKELYFQMRLSDMHSFLSYTLTRKKSNPAITSYAYDFVLQNKGLMLKSSTAMRLSILNSKDSVLLKKYDDWLSLKKEISNLYAISVEMRTKDVSVVENQANVLEKELIQGSQLFGDYRKDIQIKWKDVRANLKSNEAAVEFTNFRINRDSVFYCALIIRKDSEYPQMIKLFEEKQLKSLLNDLKENNEYAVTSVYGSKKTIKTKLYDLIWKPLEHYLKGIEIINYSPSGLLHKVSFAALSNSEARYLVDNYKLNMLSSTAIVTKATQSILNNNLNICLFGGIDYSIKDTTYSPWNYLEGTLSETDQLNSTFQKQGVKVNYLKSKTATKQEFKRLADNSNIIHIATHGFFFPEPEIIKAEENKTTNDIVSRSASRAAMANYIRNDNPLMRSGLVFAGVNDYWNGITEDIDSNGVLTALEVVNIDLRKNKLVVLSACETGLGDIKDGEGVYGLQRAFKMSGTENIIMSLWQVPDLETAEFMNTFYLQLLTTHTINEAFAETQNQMRKKYDPYYWAAFVLVR